MKLLFVLFLFTSQLINYAQVYNWSTPIAITDSLTDNTNCEVVNLNPYSDTPLRLIFWEKKIDSLTTAICYRNLTDMTATEYLLSDQNVHYKNPQAWTFFSPDTAMYLFYETNISGNWDNYLVKYSLTGNFTNPIPLAVSDKDEKNLSASTIDNRLVWEQDAQIMYCERTFNYDFNITRIDSGNCKNPVVSINYVVWEKEVNDSSHIYLSYYNNIIQSWVEPICVWDEGHNINLFFSDAVVASSLIFCWENVRDGKHNIATAVYNHQIEFLDFLPEVNKYDPTIVDFPILTKEKEISSMFLSFVVDTNSTKQIFATYDSYNYPSFINISNNNYVNRKPVFFYNHAEGNTLYFGNYWEAYVNNHWQILMSETSYRFTNISDEYTYAEDFSLSQNYPNPFNPSTKIEFTVPVGTSRDLTLQVYDVLGNEIVTLIDEQKLPGKYSVEWNAKDYPSGVYFYELRMVNNLKQSITTFRKSKKMLLIK